MVVALTEPAVIATADLFTTKSAHLSVASFPFSIETTRKEYLPSARLWGTSQEMVWSPALYGVFIVI